MTDVRNPDLLGHGGWAKLSADERYRYELGRHWGDGRTCVMIGCNPSTADAHVDDPTLRRCVGFARRESCGQLLLVNAYAFRATDPDVMLAAEDPVGPENDDYLERALTRPGALVIACWGGRVRLERHVELQNMLRRLAPRACALGLTLTGCPRHPLYLAADTPLTEAW